ncbi:hypothetical protein Hanom_Chr13g01229731 [Helianthus anomalus]
MFADLRTQRFGSRFGFHSCRVKPRMTITSKLATDQTVDVARKYKEFYIFTITVICIWTRLLINESV